MPISRHVIDSRWRKGYCSWGGGNPKRQISAILAAMVLLGVLGALSKTSAGSPSRDEEAKNAIVDRALEVVGQPSVSTEVTNGVMIELDAENASVAITAAEGRTGARLDLVLSASDPANSVVKAHSRGAQVLHPSTCWSEKE